MRDAADMGMRSAVAGCARIGGGRIAPRAQPLTATTNPLAEPGAPEFDLASKAIALLGRVIQRAGWLVYLGDFGFHLWVSFGVT